MKKVISTLVVAMSFLLVTNVSVAQCDSHTGSKTTKASCSDETSKIAAIKFHADYCGSCKNLDPKITELKSTFKDQGVVFQKIFLVPLFHQYQKSKSNLVQNLQHIFHAS